jgi:hypothetical protein
MEYQDTANAFKEDAELDTTHNTARCQGRHLLDRERQSLQDIRKLLDEEGQLLDNEIKLLDEEQQHLAQRRLLLDRRMQLLGHKQSFSTSTQ